MSKKIMSRGVGPSRLNRDPNAKAPDESLMKLHVAGTLIKDLPLNMQSKICYEHTDEAIEERNRGKIAAAAHVRAAGGDRARATGSDFDRQVEERRDFRSDAEGTEIYSAPDVMKELAEEHVPEGMTPKFLSPIKVDREGTRGYEIVTNGKGEPVKMGRMILAQMPDAKSKSRKEFYRKKGDRRLKEVHEQYQEQQRELVGE
jgi:hypothetical protein